MQPSSFHFYYTSSYIKTTPIASIRLSFGNSFRCAQRCCLVICLATRYLLFRMYFARVSTIDAIRRRSTSSKTIAMYHRQNNSHINGIPSCISIYLFSYVVNWWHRYDAVNEHPRFSPITQRALIPNHAIVMTSTTNARLYTHPSQSLSFENAITLSYNQPNCMDPIHIDTPTVYISSHINETCWLFVLFIIWHWVWLDASQNQLYQVNTYCFCCYCVCIWSVMIWHWVRLDTSQNQSYRVNTYCFCWYSGYIWSVSCIITNNHWISITPHFLYYR